MDKLSHRIGTKNDGGGGGGGGGGREEWNTDDHIYLLKTPIASGPNRPKPSDQAKKVLQLHRTQVSVICEWVC